MALLDEWQAPEPSPYFDVRLNARLREERQSSLRDGCTGCASPLWPLRLPADDSERYPGSHE